MNTVYFRVYEELNDYLPEERQKTRFSMDLPSETTLGKAVERIGIPVLKVDLVLVNHEPVGFNYVLGEGDRISVFPSFERFDISGVSKLRDQPLREPRFVCDVHLGKLSEYLRMLGFDTLYSNKYTPESLIKTTQSDNRILLSRDQKLVKKSNVERTCFVKSPDPRAQIKAVVQDLQLTALAKPFTRCLRCNSQLAPVDKTTITPRLEPKTAKYYAEFYICLKCDRLYWKGSHYERMMHVTKEILFGK